MRISTIVITDALTTKIIYEELLVAIGKYIQEKKQGEVDNLLFDLSKCTTIEGNAIPNILCIGQIIKKTTGVSPYFYCTGTEEGKRINGFLEKINFYNINDDIDVYDVKRGASCADVQYALPEYCTTVILKQRWFLRIKEISSMSEMQKKNMLNYRVGNYISQKYSEFFLSYCEEFVYWWKRFEGDQEAYYKVNLLEKYATELGVNALLHGEEDCVLTIQSNKTTKKISIAIADCGKGIYRSIREKIRKQDKNYLLSESTILFAKDVAQYELELRAIILALIYRKKEAITGLHEILEILVEHNGVLMIHSGRIRVKVGECDLIKAIRAANTVDDIISISKLLRRKGCVQETKLYEGTHIEIEMLMEKKNNV